MKIEIFGMGCENCKRVEENAKKAVKELGISAEIIKIEDFEALIRKGITATPGLVIDDEIVSLGRIPSVEEIKEILSSSDRVASQPLILTGKGSSPSCGCSSKATMIYACSGGSNVGQTSNEAAKILAARGRGNFACLSGVGAQKESFINNAKKANTIVVIDGCGSKCALKTLERAGIDGSLCLVLTDLGMIKDTSVLDTKKEDVEKVVTRVEEMLP